MRSTDRTVVVTGAGGGIGALLTRRFLDNGDTVVATDASADALERLGGEADHPRLLTRAADVTDETAVAAVAAVAREHSGVVHVLVNCHGWFPILALEETSAQQWRRIVDVNLTGAFLTVTAMLPLMRDAGGAAIVNFGSGSVFDGTAGQAPYVAAKAGIVGFSRSLAREVGDYGITVNVVTPGLTVTDAVRDSFPADVLERQRDAGAIRREEVPEDLVGPVFFLASPDAAFVSGQTLNVDGGRSMR